jgi:hypothetical protein
MRQHTLLIVEDNPSVAAGHGHVLAPCQAVWRTGVARQDALWT